MSDHTFYPLEVAAVKQETADTSSITFSIPTELEKTFQYKAGQYLTLKFDISGKEERRAYSMSSSPFQEGITVSVKRVQGGKVSNHILDQVKVGNTVEVMPPDGRFVVTPDPAVKKTYYLIGAGSGITPLMSMIRTILEDEPKSNIYLFYGNRNRESIIFHDDLKSMQERYAGQIQVVHILSQPKKKKAGGMFGMFKKAKTDWEGYTGRITAELVQKLLLEYTPHCNNVHYYICGPGTMIQSLEAFLQGQGVDKKYIHREFFTVVKEEGATVKAATDGAMAKINLNGETLTIEVPKGKTVLDALLDLGHDVPYSCMSGTCSTCMAKVHKGKVEMEVYYAIDEDEVEEGYILTCQAHPTTSEVEMTFEV
ncbi:MAG: ferredoxin--NADP reductase [Bacteroidota bacterium]